MEKKTSYSVKFVLIGDSNVGKSNIAYRYVNGGFLSNYIKTIGVVNSFKDIEINNKLLHLELWDSAGSETFSSVRQQYYDNSACVLIIYDVTNKESFESIDNWINDCDMNCKNDNLIIALIGNKTDKKDERQVSEEEGMALKERFKNSHNIFFYESSALTGYNIDEIFIDLCTKVCNLIEKGEELKGIKEYSFDNFKATEVVTEERISLINENANNQGQNNNKSCCCCCCHFF